MGKPKKIVKQSDPVRYTTYTPWDVADYYESWRKAAGTPEWQYEPYAKGYWGNRGYQAGAAMAWSEDSKATAERQRDAKILRDSVNPKVADVVNRAPSIHTSARVGKKSDFESKHPGNDDDYDDLDATNLVRYAYTHGGRSGVYDDKNVIKMPRSENLRLRTGGYVNKNVLKALYEASKQAGVPFRTALGLAARESGLGQVRSYNTGMQETVVPTEMQQPLRAISKTDLLSNWQQFGTIYLSNAQEDRLNDLYTKYRSAVPLTAKETEEFRKLYKKKQAETFQPIPSVVEDPLVNGLKHFKSGDYNNSPTYYNAVQKSADEYLSDKNLQEYLRKMGML